MALLRGLNATKILRPCLNGNRPFHFLGPNNQLDVFGAQTGVRKIPEPNDYFTKHGGEGSSNVARAFMDNKMNGKMTSLPSPPPLYRPIGTPSDKNAKLKPRSKSNKRIRVCHNRTARTVVKPIRVPIIIDITNVREQPKVFPSAPPHPPPVRLTLSRRFLDLSKDAAWVLLHKTKEAGVAKLRKIEPPRLDARKLKKIAVVGVPVVTSLIGYIYGKLD